MCYPRIKHFKKWLLVAEEELPNAVIDDLKLVRIGTGQVLYTFDSNDGSLSDVYCTVVGVFKKYDFDCAIIILKPENGEFVY